MKSNSVGRRAKTLRILGCLLVAFVVVWLGNAAVSLYVSAAIEQQSVAGVEALLATPCMLDAKGQIRREVLIRSERTGLLTPRETVTVTYGADDECAKQYASRLDRPDINVSVVREVRPVAAGAP